MDRRPSAVARFAPVALLLVACSFVPLTGSSSAAADPVGPVQARLAALTAQVSGAATHIHQLTEQLDQARLQVDTTSARLAGVTKQDAATVQMISANRAVLLEQALRAYMNGGASPAMATSQSADLAVSTEYLTVASGDLTATGDQLHQMDVSLRIDQAMLRTAQQDNLQAAAHLQAVRANALSVAATEQAQLDGLQAQLAAQAQAAAAAASSAAAAATQSNDRATVPSTQGLPVNNGLVSVVQRAIGLVTATPVNALAPVSLGAGTGGGGGNAGGSWLALRQCESSDNYAENTGNGFYGAYQFSQSTWTGLGFPGRPDQEPPAMQDQAAMKLQAQSGWGQWPACASALGLA